MNFTADPETGRFISQDSYRGELEDPGQWHLYAYCANNPINYVDPSGHYVMVLPALYFGGVAEVVINVAITVVLAGIVYTVAAKAIEKIKNSDKKKRITIKRDYMMVKFIIIIQKKEMEHICGMEKPIQNKGGTIMKPILLSSEGNCSLYNAPDTVAEALKWYCNNYIKYIGTDVEELCFCEEDFVNYMNNIVLSDERIVFVKSIGFISSREQLPTEFRTYPWFDF